MKKVWVAVLFLILIIGGSLLFQKFSPPLEIGTIAYSKDKEAVVVGIENKGFRAVEIIDVSVNNDEIPAKTSIQVSNALQGFTLTKDYDAEEAQKFGFTNLDETTIRSGTTTPSNFEKLDNGTATEDDVIYGVSVIHDEGINKVHIKYSYLGMSFNRIVTLD